MRHPFRLFPRLADASDGWQKRCFGLLLRALVLVGCWSSITQVLAAPPLNADSLKARLHRPGQPDTARVRTYWLLARALRNVQLDSARQYAQQGVTLARRIQDAPGLAYSLNALASSEYHRGDYPAAQHAYEATLAAARRANLCPLTGLAYSGLGVVADAMNNVPGAVAYFEQARAVYATCRPAIPDREVGVLTNIGNTYLQVGQYDRADRPLRQALALVRPSTTAPDLLNLLDLIGLLQLAQHHPDSAAATFGRELRLARAAHERRFETYAVGNLASTRLALGQPAAALPYAQQALRLARLTGDQSQVDEYTLVLARVLGALRRPEAFDTLLRYTKLHDELKSRARNQEIVRQQTLFGVAEQQARIRALSQQRRISQLRAEQQTARARQYGLLAGALLLLLLGGGALLMALQRSRHRLQASETALRQANKTQQKLMRIIGHDLRGPVAMFQQVTPLLRAALGDEAPRDAVELVEELDGTAQHVGALVDNLLDWARLQGGLVSSHPVRLRATTAVQSVVQLYAPVAQHKGIAVGIDVAAEAWVWADLTLLTTVLRNLLANAIKFTPTGGAVAVTAQATATGVRFGVQDTGRGMPAAALALAMGAENAASQPGTAGEPGTGLGLPLCRHFVALLGGELHGEPNDQGPGLQFWFELPTLPAVAAHEPIS
ncbi:tetratricopeptide repeat protein [Hymenobacter sp. BT683]|uniref:histidine kinase n=1 Tax=Hymenobacter jeongseonensis TaxID=2791027 RepID=A0ABS0ILK3_9BACT|nr:tetratricopeptide repeat protein [Hymenobacter jeongseonensis]MBF9239251.1 tetratricopeptide repeat protein [Hymenobacter jeongseonensis]